MKILISIISAVTVSLFCYNGTANRNVYALKATARQTKMYNVRNEASFWPKLFNVDLNAGCERNLRLNGKGC